MIKPIDKIFIAFFESKEEKLYFNQLQKLTNLSPSSLNNTIKLLKTQKILKEIKTLSNTYYYIFDKDLKNIEFSKIALSKFNSLNYQITFPIKEFINEIENVKSILLFGSSSRGEQKDGSDIDLLVIINSFKNKKLNKIYFEEISNLIENAKQKANSISLYPLSVFIIDEENFVNNKKDYLIQSAKNTGFPIYNREQYYMLSENEN